MSAQIYSKLDWEVMKFLNCFYSGAASVVIALVTCGCTAQMLGKKDDTHTTPVIVTPVQHMGKLYSVEDVYVNGHIAGGAGQAGGGGGMSCCVLLPEYWRPGLIANVTWTVKYWGLENIEETKHGIYKSIITLARYKAEVPVERYQDPETLYIHFFSDGRARVVASIYDPFDARHPISQRWDEASLAVVGQRVIDGEKQATPKKTSHE
ncbi:DUF3304 domain-containing protein [Pseudoduganella armeniaca]|uniref:DUF3304 domain-containing protein n=1 Tax=Pseudoduganella armeniaca TaxID=2072590 RepID=A0A2R4C3U2_9BURK|nr:DUF3304 domain-containing protein [Pseudoduganella armeniaca]AVR94273.1 hypothetical protein C9I28_00030 [Pseudoduganella armeniaca]